MQIRTLTLLSSILAALGSMLLSTAADAIALRVISNSTDLVITDNSAQDQSNLGGEVAFSGTIDGFDIDLFAVGFTDVVFPYSPPCCTYVAFEGEITSNSNAGPIRIFVWEDDFSLNTLQKDLTQVTFGTTSDSTYLYRTFLDFSGTDWAVQTSPNDVFNAPITQSLAGTGPVIPALNQRDIPIITRASIGSPFTVGFEVLVDHTAGEQSTYVNGYNEPVGTVPTPAGMPLLIGAITLLGVLHRYR